MTDNTLTPSHGGGQVEFSRLIKTSALTPEGDSYSAKATPAECEALARRFDLQGLKDLTIEADARRWRKGVRVTGRLTAEATQKCIVTLEPVPATIDETFDRGFLPEQDIVGDVKPGAEVEIEDDPELGDLPDILTDTLDLGEIAAETLSLALDPYPRSAEADFADHQAGPPGETPMTDEDAKPFASLAAYREKLAGQKDED